MEKRHFEDELRIRACSKGAKSNNKRDVKKIQEWLNLWHIKEPEWNISAIEIDGDYGPQTNEALTTFFSYYNAANIIKEKKTIKYEEAVTQKHYDLLCAPLRNAYGLRPMYLSTYYHEPVTFSAKKSFGTLKRAYSLIVEYAEQHFTQAPRELQIIQENQTIGNMGPWVRSYMNGSAAEGTDFLWCMGFVFTILDLAFYTLDLELKNETEKMHVSCDEVAKLAIKKGELIKNKEINSRKDEIRAGNVFLLKKRGVNDWIHTGIIVEVKDDHFKTIEGNTNKKGSPNGIGVFKRERYFSKENIDVWAF